MPSHSGIYQIRNTVNGKIYVGSTKCLRVRWNQHRNDLRRGRHGNRHLQNAWHKHGAHAFAFEPLLVCSADDLLFYEQRTIDVMKPAYNLRPGAANNAGYKFSDEQKAELRRIKSETPWAERMSASKTGSTRDEDVKKRISLRMREVTANPAWRNNIAARHTGAKRSDAAKAHMRAARVEFYKDPANRAKSAIATADRAGLIRLTLNGASHTITQWAELTGLSVHAIRQRYDAGWSTEKILVAPNQKALIEYRGEKKLLADWARQYNLKPTTLAKRLKEWGVVEQAFTAPVRDWSKR